MDNRLSPVADTDRAAHTGSRTECLECGGVFTQPGFVEPGGMSCVRCC
jgi:hypothetical protein